MLNCGVTKTVVFGYSCRCTVYHTQNNNFDQNIGIFWHKRTMLVTIILRNIMFLKKKINCHETIHNGSIGMASRLVGFLKQVKNRVSDWSLWGKAIACWFPHSCRLLNKSVRLIRAEKKRTQLRLQTGLAEKIEITSLTEVTAWAQQI